MSSAEARRRLTERLRQELSQPPAAEAAAFAQHLARHYGPAVAAILFYGSCLRERRCDGLLDFYVIVDDYSAVMSAIGAAAARLLPPTVYHRTLAADDRVLRAKVAVISQPQLARRMRPEGLDGSLWARFCQPVALVYARDDTAADSMLSALAEGLITAGLWAARLGPESGRADDYWRALFRATYAAELRVEAGDRSAKLVATAPERYAAMLSDAWRALGFPVGDEIAANPLPASARRQAGRAWRRRRWANRSLNVLRLMKAAFTFDGGADYIAWKIERHARRGIPLSPFQRKHPILAAPAILWLVIRGRNGS
jgi:hypothetical protein